MADTAGDAPQTRRRSKAPGAFRTIGEVATDLEVPQHVLRFWESKFAQVKPLKRGGGRRYYRPEDVDLLRGIRHLLYSDGYTIKGVQKLLREIGSKSIMESGRSLSGSAAAAAAGAAGVAVTLVATDTTTFLRVVGQQHISAAGGAAGGLGEGVGVPGGLIGRLLGV